MTASELIEPAALRVRGRAAYSREDLGSLTASLAFAGDLAGLRRELERSIYGDASCCEYHADGEPLAAAFLVLLDELERGTEPVAAIVTTLAAWHEAHEGGERARIARRERGQAAYEKARADEEITRKAECPHCGAEPGTACRTVGEVRHMRSWSHRSRFRLARSLNDGAQDEEAAQS
jgi:hypothetical protein